MKPIDVRFRSSAPLPAAETREVRREEQKQADTLERTHGTRPESLPQLVEALRGAIEARHERTGADGVSGQRVRAGVATGRLVTAPTQEPYVLLVRDDSPETLRAALGARAIVVEQGRKHPFAATFAKLGRPVIALGRTGAASLPLGSEVTVDATRGVVASGKHAPLGSSSIADVKP